jgi:hypothetical protein
MWMSGEDVSQKTRDALCKKLSAKFTTIKFQDDPKEQSPKKLASQAMRERPLIVVLARNSEVFTATLSPQEKELHSKIVENTPGLGAVIWITNADQNRPNVTECHIFQNHAISGLTDAYSTEELFQQALQGPDSLADLMNDKAKAYRRNADEVQKLKKGKFKEAQSNIAIQFREYIRHKKSTVTTEELRTRFENLREQNEQNLHKVRQMEEQFEVHLPPPTILGNHPWFTDKAAVVWVGTKQVAEVKELKLRSFLNAILVAQILEHAEKVGGQIFDEVVTNIVTAVSGQFKLRNVELLEYIEEYAKEREEVQNIAAFLRRQSFVTMYVGGTVMSLMPLLQAIVMPELCTKVDRELPKPDLADYKQKKEAAEQAIRAMNITDS